MNTGRSRIFNIVLAAFFAALPALAGAQDTAQIEQREREIASEVLSPFCPGRALNDCPSSAASELRSNIRGMVADGKSKDEIMTQLFSIYGDQIRALPKSEGFGLVGWVMPAIFLILGGLFLVIWLRARKAAAGGQEIQKTIDPAVQARIDAELNKH